MGADMRLVQRRRVQDRSDPSHRARDDGAVGDRADDVRERRGEDVEPYRLATRRAKRAHQRFAEVARTSGDENGHGLSGET